MCHRMRRVDLSMALKLLGKKTQPPMIFLEGPPGKPMQNALARIYETCPALPVFTINRWQSVSEMRSWFTGYFMEMARSTPSNPPKNASAYGLSARELEILRLMVKGLIKKEIAEQLSLSYHTVDNHERHIFSKMNAHTRTAVVAKALIEKLF
ncbi:MAG: LuxR C-terminal-related transcriptional regulator [Verrucomicrobiota bacterium]